MNNIDLSIIIPIYNAGTLLNRCLDSIFNQQTIFLYQIILIDDGSTDNTIELIKERKEKNIIFLQQKNSGPAAARNKGLEIAEGKYCAYLDADDYWEPYFIQKTIDFLENNPPCVAVNVAQRHLTISGNFISPQCFSLYNHPFIINNFFKFWAANMHICTGSAVIRTSILKTIGGQRNDLRITEDLELWALIATYGNWGFIPEILFVSDGNNITRNQGWLNKMIIRWNNAPCVADWERRIIKRFSTEEIPQSYKKARGKIARNLIYCQILSDRLTLSRKEAIKYGQSLPKDLISILINISKHTSFTWWLLYKFLKYREYHRK